MSGSPGGRVSAPRPPRWFLALCLVALQTPAAGWAEIRFSEVSESWSLVFRHHHGGSGKRYMVETMAGGVVVFDFDGDGDNDVLFVDGGVLPGYLGEKPRTSLYRNDGPGTFVDYTIASGLDFGSYGMGATASDIDGDGWLDLYITAFGPNALYRNRGDGTFEEITEEAAAQDPRWNASASFSDVDRDGDLDLYVSGYVDFTPQNHRTCSKQGIEGYCQPEAYDAIQDRFFRNLGRGKFEEATESAGFGIGEPTAGLGVVFGDLTGDRWPDLYVANDSHPNHLFRNRGDGTFEETALLAGAAYSDAGRPEAGMGVDLGDVDGDGLLDIIVTNFEMETNALYRNLGDGLFVDSRWANNIAESSLLNLAFGVDLADFDQDGDLDLAIANGHINDTAAELFAAARYEQPNQVFENLGTGRFQLATPGFETDRVSRGLATGDLDGDGDLELLVVNSNDRADIYENLGGEAAWSLVDLEGATSNSFGIDSEVILESNGSRQVASVRSGSSYLSQSSLTLHFGLDRKATEISVLTAWPGGKLQRWDRLPPNHRLRLVEGR